MHGDEDILNKRYDDRYLPCVHIPCDFPDNSVGKESTCNAGDPSLIPGWGRSAEEEIGYPLQYSWASLVAQLVKNPPAMWETWVQSLGFKDPPGEGKGYLENSSPCVVHGVAKIWTQLYFHIPCILPDPKYNQIFIFNSN